MHSIRKLLMIICNTYIWDGYIFGPSDRLKYSPVDLWSLERKELWHTNTSLTDSEFGHYNLTAKSTVRFGSLIDILFFIVGMT